jgi:hypothetical protein
MRAPERRPMNATGSPKELANMASDVAHASRLAAAVAFVLAALAGAAAAGEIPEPRASYAGEGVMTSEAGAMPFRVFADGAIERREVTAENGTHVVIKRPDLGVAYLMTPDDHMAVEVSGDAGSLPDSAEEMRTFDTAPVGSEKIAGEPATKYAVSGVNADGAGFDGFAWVTDDGILLKMEGTASSGGTDMPMSVELTGLTRGPQDPALFELPPGMPVMRLGGMKIGHAGATHATPPGGPVPRSMPDLEATQGMQGMPDMEALSRELERQRQELQSLQGQPETR